MIKKMMCGTVERRYWREVQYWWSWSDIFDRTSDGGGRSADDAGDGVVNMTGKVHWGFVAIYTTHVFAPLSTCTHSSSVSTRCAHWGWKRKTAHVCYVWLQYIAEHYIEWHDMACHDMIRIMMTMDASRDGLWCHWSLTAREASDPPPAPPPPPHTHTLYGPPTHSRTAVTPAATIVIVRTAVTCCDSEDSSHVLW